MIENKIKEKPPKKPFSGSAIFTCVAATIFTIVFLISDKGPPKPPFDDSFSSIDCNDIMFRNVVDRGGKLDFLLNTKPTVEYPIEYLPYFIRIQIANEDGFSLNYNSSNIRNADQLDGILKFSIDHGFSGNCVIAVFCLKKKLHQENYELKMVNSFNNDLSHFNHIPNTAISLHKTCFEYEKILFFYDFVGIYKKFPFDDSAFNFEFLAWSIDSYLYYKNVTLMKETTFMIAPFNEEPWKQLLLNINPLAAEISRRPALKPDNTHIIYRGEPDSIGAEFLPKFTSLNVTKLEDIQCFSDIVMTRTFYGVSVRNESVMDNAILENCSLTKEKFERSDLRKGRIVCQNRFYNEISERMKDCEVISLDPNMPLIEAAKLVSSAEVLVGDHISILCHSIWLRKSAKVIDITARKYACNRWIDKYSKNVDAKIISLYNQTKCECPTFSCYPETVENQFGIDFNNLANLIRKEMI